MRYCHLIFLLFFSMFSIFCKAQTDRQLIRKGNREFQKKNYVNAEIEFRKAIAFNPTNPQALYNLGTALLMQKKDSVAIKMLQKACKVEKNEVRKAQCFHNIGYICQSHQMYVEAIQAYKEALQYNPNDDETRYNLALCKKLLKNNPQKALAILEEGRKILYRSPHLYAKIIDEKYINYIESLITSEI